MSYSPFNIIGNSLFVQGYDVIIDQTQTGYIYFGMTESDGTSKLTSDAKWAICRLAITETNKLNTFRWANAKGMQFKNQWNTSGGTTFLNAGLTF